MVYAELTVVVDGAVESEETFTDYLLMDERVREIGEDAQGDGYPTEVFIQYHEHDITDGECLCVQYETDRKPAHSWNVSD